ncbi:MAG: hypothetical protein IBJ03_05555 [Gemmatimonadaceae bacterium]|nr:hypothetical protein [Gemmatimonadaceae bacterium]
MRISFNTLRRAIVGAAAVTSVLAAPTLTAQTIEQAGNGIPLYGVGVPSIATFGQTFVSPLDGLLNSFSFWLSNEGNAPDANTVDAQDLKFRAYVMAWDGGKAVGPALYTSDIVFGPTQVAQEFAFSPASLNVTAGTTYVAFLSAAGLFGDIVGFPSSALLLSDEDGSGGSLVFLDSGDDTSLFTNPTADQAWMTGTEFGAPQAQFKAAFSTTVPEPGAAVLLVTGFGALGLVRIGRRRTA